VRTGITRRPRCQHPDGSSTGVDDLAHPDLLSHRLRELSAVRHAFGVTSPSRGHRAHAANRQEVTLLRRKTWRCGQHAETIGASVRSSPLLLHECDRVVRRLDNIDAVVIPAAGFDVLVHDERNGHPQIEIVDNERTAGSFPERHAMAS
jgi:hypothetical protein